jgi:hypothetical protein
MNPGSFFSELKRRNVYKVAITYAVVAWLLVQVGSILFPTFEAPTWVMQVFVTAIAVGFPIALVMAWAFELTPQGIKRTEAAKAAQEHSARGGWIALSVITAALSLGLFLAGTLYGEPVPRLDPPPKIYGATSRARRLRRNR